MAGRPATGSARMLPPAPTKTAPGNADTRRCSASGQPPNSATSASSGCAVRNASSAPETISTSSIVGSSASCSGRGSCRRTSHDGHPGRTRRSRRGRSLSMSCSLTGSCPMVDRYRSGSTVPVSARFCMPGATSDEPRREEKKAAVIPARKRAAALQVQSWVSKSASVAGTLSNPAEAMTVVPAAARNNRLFRTTIEMLMGVRCAPKHPQSIRSPRENARVVTKRKAAVTAADTHPVRTQIAPVIVTRRTPRAISSTGNRMATILLRRKKGTPKFSNVSSTPRERPTFEMPAATSTAASTTGRTI